MEMYMLQIMAITASRNLVVKGLCHRFSFEMIDLIPCNREIK
jgi:hypothetical protein